jgi:hypothetical protein
MYSVTTGGALILTLEGGLPLTSASDAINFWRCTFRGSAVSSLCSSRRSSSRLFVGPGSGFRWLRV